MKNRFVSFVVLFSLFINICVHSIVFADTITNSSTSSEEYSTNIEMLDSILYGSRKYVLDTLIREDFSTNPHALVNNLENENLMMFNVLDQYGNKDNPDYNGAYKTAVDIMEKVYNGEEYAQSVADYITEFAAGLLSIFNADAEKTMSDLTYSVGELKYESIIKEALAADYTASDGTKLSTKEAELKELERLNKGFENLKAFTSFFKTFASANYGESAFEDRGDYFNDYLVPYGEAMEDVLSTFEDVNNDPNTEDMIKFTSFLAALTQYERYEAQQKQLANDVYYYAPTFFIDEENLGYIKGADKAISTISKTISSYMFINEIRTQSLDVGNSLKRMSSHADKDMANILNKFSNNIIDAGNEQLAQYESVMQYLRNQGVVTELGKDFVEKQIKKSIGEQVTAYGSYVNAGVGSTVLSVATKAVNVASISSWCADVTMSFGDTCKKTYELKYLDKILDVAHLTYSSDLEAYLLDKTDDNAKKVLDDLLIIQKLRLRGENIAYSMMKGQFDSPMGRLISTGTLNKDTYLLDHLEWEYQCRVDALIGASTVPLTTQKIMVNNGETLTLHYNEAKGGLYAEIRKTNGKSYGLAELAYRFSNGIVLNSGSRMICLEDMPSVYIPYVENNGADIYITQGVHLTEFVQKAGNVTLGNENVTVEDLKLKGGTVKSSYDVQLVCDRLNVSATVPVNIPIVCKEELNVTGNISGSTVYLSGSSTGGSGTVEKLVVNGSNNQNLTGTLNVGNLTFRNTGTVVQNGTIYVSNTIENTSSKVFGGHNTILKSTGSIIGSHYNSGLTLDGVTTKKSVTFGDSLYTKGITTLTDVKVQGLFNQQSGTLNLNGNAELCSDVNFGGTVTQTDKSIIINGDLTTSGGSVTLGSLILNGKLKQSINNPITVASFTNNNPKGITINAAVTVNGAISSHTPITNGKSITLTENASFADDSFTGDITVAGLSGEFPSQVLGTIYMTNGNITQAKDMECTSLQMSGGTLNIENSDTTITGVFDFGAGTVNLTNANLTVKNLQKAYTSGGTINIDADSKYTNSTDAVLSGTVTGDGTYYVQGDLTNNGTVNVGSMIITSKLPTTISGNNINTAHLSINSPKGVTINNKINVSQSYTSTGKVVNPENILFSGGNNINDDVVYTVPLNIEGDLIVDGKTVIAKDDITVKGNITVCNGGKLITENLTLTNGSLTVSGDSTLTIGGLARLTGTSSNTISVDETSEIDFKKLAIVSTYSSITNDGILRFGGDVSISSATLTGSGTMYLRGDLYSSSLTINRFGTLNLNGLLPQKLSCSSSPTFDNIIISNPSRGGVTFNNTFYYYETYEKGENTVSGTVSHKEA